MRHIIRFSFVFTFLFAGITALNAQNPNPSSAIDNLVLSEMSGEKLAGVTTIIVKGGEIVWMQAYGQADVPNNVAATDNTVFMLASISKIFTGTALMQLAENGDIDLDEDINNHLPFTIEIPGFESDSITFRDIMTHTSSISDGNAMDGYYSLGDPTITLADCIQRYFSTAGSDYNATDNFQNTAPGTNYEYSNMATALAGYLVEVVSGMPFDQYCDQEIFAPLCMDETSWYLSAYDTNNVARPHQYTGGQYVPYAHYGFADYPDGQLRSNTLDIANYMLAFLQGGTFNSNSILTPASVNEMLSLQVPALDGTQGLNWYQEVLYTSSSQVNVWGHNGGESGVSTDLYLDPANDLGLAVLSNGEGTCLYICDALYEYGLTLSATGSGNPSCAPVGIVEDNFVDDVQAYPNPFSSELNFNLPANDQSLQFELLDVTGRLVAQQNGIVNATFQYQRNELESGVYFYRFLTEKGQLVTSGKVVAK
jgi:CubicO group peptidase (beta-lactamase class C family)